MNERAPSVAGAERVHYLDWLKVLIVYGICVYHVSLIFSGASWLVSNRQSSAILGAFAGFCFPWGIPAMFMISGADSWFGFRSRSGISFVRARFVRLVLPMLAGIAILSPLQRWVTSSNPPPPIDSIFGAYPTFYKGLRLDWTPQWLGTYGLHLWFLGYLFAISVVALPLMAWIRRPSGQRFVDWLLGLTAHRGGMYLFLAPLVISQVLLRQRFPAYQDWADIATYTLVFVFGFIITSHRGFEKEILRDARLAVGLGITATIGVASLLGLGSLHLRESAPQQTLHQVSFAVFWSLYIWSWLLAVLALGIRWLNRPSRVISYANESVLAFYVIHHPLVVTFGSLLVVVDLPVWPKFFLILGLAMGGTLLIYEYIVRRWRVTRALFGLKPPPRRRPADRGGGSPTTISAPA